MTRLTGGSGIRAGGNRHLRPATQRPARQRARGFSLIELLIVMVVLVILLALAFPSYKSYIIRISREQAQTQLLALAGLEEKIFLNSNAYAVGSGKVTAAYDGSTNGGLGLTSGTTSDGKYTIAVAARAGAAATFLLTATPVANTTQVGDGDITIDEAGTRTWGAPSKPW